MSLQGKACKSDCRSEESAFSTGLVAIIVNYSCTLLIYWSGLLMGVCFVCIKISINNSPIWSSMLLVLQTIFPFPAKYLYKCQFSIKSCNFIHCNFCMLISIYFFSPHRLSETFWVICWEKLYGFLSIWKKHITAKKHSDKYSLPLALTKFIPIQSVGLLIMFIMRIFSYLACL